MNYKRILYTPGIYGNKTFFFPIFFKIKINRNAVMLDFSFLNKEKNGYFI